MVTATDNPKVWRVEIPILHSPVSKSEIVCYVALSDDGMRVYYSHHMLYDRPVEAGPWENPKVTWHTVNPQLVAQIEAAMSSVLWEIARGSHALEVLPLPVEMNQNRLNPSLKELEL